MFPWGNRGVETHVKGYRGLRSLLDDRRVDAVDERDEASDRNPFGENRIEVDRREMDRASPAAWVGRLSTRLDAAVSRLAWRR